MNINYDEIKDTLLSNYYRHFDEEEIFDGEKIKDIKVKLKTVFTLHNFKTGVIWFNYSREIINEEDEVIYGSWKDSVKMNIKEVNGKWHITDIYEQP